MWPIDHTFMMPADALNKIKSVKIYHDDDSIVGFSFFDKDGALLWKIARTALRLSVEKVVLAENEVIIGVKAKLHPKSESAYTDF